MNTQDDTARLNDGKQYFFFEKHSVDDAFQRLGKFSFSNVPEHVL